MTKMLDKLKKIIYFIIFIIILYFLFIEFHLYNADCYLLTDKNVEIEKLYENNNFKAPLGTSLGLSYFIITHHTFNKFSLMSGNIQELGVLSPVIILRYFRPDFYYSFGINHPIKIVAEVHNNLQRIPLSVLNQMIADMDQTIIVKNISNNRILFIDSSNLDLLLNNYRNHYVYLFNENEFLNIYKTIRESNFTVKQTCTISQSYFKRQRKYILILNK